VKRRGAEVAGVGTEPDCKRGDRSEHEGEGKEFHGSILGELIHLEERMF